MNLVCKREHQGHYRQMNGVEVQYTPIAGGAGKPPRGVPLAVGAGKPPLRSPLAVGAGTPRQERVKVVNGNIHEGCTEAENSGKNRTRNEEARQSNTKGLEGGTKESSGGETTQKHPSC